jgi:hypothetical protein
VLNYLFAKFGTTNLDSLTLQMSLSPHLNIIFLWIPLEYLGSRSIACFFFHLFLLFTVPLIKKVLKRNILERTKN